MRQAFARVLAVALLGAEALRGALTTFSLGYAYEYDNRITGLNPKGGVFIVGFEARLGGVVL